MDKDYELLKKRVVAESLEKKMRKENKQYRKKTKRKSKIFNVLLIIIILIIGACAGAFLVANDLIDNIDNEKSSESSGDYVPDNIENIFIETFNLENNGNFITEFKDFLKKLLGRQ
jgi:flagellar basal body-associated protein FliL